MNRLQNKIISELKKSIVLGLRSNRDRVLSISKRTEEGFVPRDTGNLSMSGHETDTANSTGVVYNARGKNKYHYASIVEAGIDKDIPIRGDQIIRRKGYTDKKGNYHPPKDIVLKNKRLVYIRKKVTTVTPEGKFRYSREPVGFRVISKISARPGQFFLARAAKEGLQYLAEDIVWFMNKVHGVTVSRK